MGIQTLPQLGGLSTQFAQSFGKPLLAGIERGLKRGEELGEREIKAARAKQGLAGLSDAVKQGRDPLEVISELVTNAGLDSSQVQAILPFLLKQLGRDANLGSQQQAIPERERMAPETTGEAFGQSPPQQGVQALNQLQGTPQAAPQEFNPIVIDDTSISERARKIGPRFPFHDADKLRAEAEKQLTQEKANVDETRELFQKSFEKKLEKAGVGSFQDIPGEVQESVLQKTLGRVQRGELAPEKAAQIASTEMLDLAKVRAKAASFGGFFNRLFAGRTTPKPAEMRKSLDVAREEYKKHGALEQFKDDILIKNHGMSEEFANFITYPIKDNSQLAKKLGSEIAKKKSARKSPSELVEDISEVIGPNDSLNSISLALSQEGYNPEEIRDAFTEIKRTNPDRLNARQIRELAQPFVVRANSADHFLLNAIGNILSKKDRLESFE